VKPVRLIDRVESIAQEVRAAQEAQEAPAADAPAATLRAPVDARSAMLVVVCVVAGVAALYWARTFFVSLLLGILIAYALSPVVSRLQRLRLPRWAASVLVMAAFCSAIVLAAGMLGGQIRSVLEQLPEAAKRVSATISSARGERGTLQKVQAAARELEKAAAQATGTPQPPATKVPAVVVEPAGFRLSTFLWANSLSVASFIGQTVMVLFLAFFLLLSGDTFKHKLVRIAGPSLTRRAITLEALGEINVSIQQFMFMLLATNALLAALSWVVYYFIGLENPGAWALAAGVLHMIPYAGTALLVASLGVTAFVQFGSWLMVAVTVGSSLALAGLVGLAVATWMTGRQARMNHAAVFVALLFWGWLWGIWGLLLAIPIIVTLKVASERIEQLKPVAELLRA
jgi:predicted PurR-regulated permease PerM